MNKFLKYAAAGLLASTALVAGFSTVDVPLANAATYKGEIIAAPDVAVVDTKYGKLQGYIHKGIYNYKGVQYAQAERFMPPREIDSWNGIKAAMTYGPVCLQLIDQQNDIFPPHWYLPHWLPRNLPQSDNCQNLNIWTPALDNQKRPVMVWLHGGGHSAGSASVEDVYDGENLSRKGDVVVVSINHRLNSIGYLDFSAYDDKYSANNGMLDIIAALEWIHDNIAKFGGDPNNVTVFGQSGGGAKVLTLTAMPAAKNLFHKAIVQSGANETMGMSLPDKEISRRVAELTLKNLGISANEIYKLQTMPYSELSTAANNAMIQAGEEFGADRVYPSSMGWSPIIDGVNVSQNPVIGGFSEQAKNIPLIIGTVANEWATIDKWATMEISQTDNKNNWSKTEIENLLREKYGANTDKVKSAFHEAYPNKPIANALYVDTWLRSRAMKTANTKAAQNGAPVYSYVFTWETPIMGGFGMAYHCSELPFIFNNIEYSGMATGATKDAYKLADKMSQAWINFARTGDPSVKGLQWLPYTLDGGATMIFDNKSELRYHHDEKLMRLLLQDYDW